MTAKQLVGKQNVNLSVVWAVRGCKTTDNEQLVGDILSAKFTFSPERRVEDRFQLECGGNVCVLFYFEDNFGFLVILP